MSRDRRYQQTFERNPDGSWSTTGPEPIPMQGWVAKMEERLRRRGLTRLPNLMARWDERNLGR